MAEIPKRWKEELSQDGDTLLRQCAEELGSAEARIRELEQERGAGGTNWFPESFVSQLQAQLAAVQKERDWFENAFELLRSGRATPEFFKEKP